MKGLRTRLARGAASAFVVNGVGVGVAFLAQLVAARVLGVESYGVFSFVLAWVMLLATAANLGFEMGLVRFASPYHDQRDLDRLRGIIQFAEQRVLLAGLAVAGGGLLVFGLGPGIPHELRWTFFLALVAVPLIALMRVRLTLVRTYGRVAQALIPDRIARESVFILLLAVFLALQPQPLTAPYAAAALAIGAALGLALITRWSRHAAPPGLGRATPLADQRPTWRRTIWPLWLLSLSQLAMRRMDVLVLGFLIGTNASGIFFACFVAAQAIAFPLLAVNFLFSPTIAALHARGDRVALQKAVTSTSWWTTLAALAFGAPIVVFAPELLQLFGPGFAEHADVLRVLVLGQLVNAAAGATVPLLALTGGERHALSISLGAMAAKLALILALIPVFGILGAAVVEALFRAGWNIAMGVAIWRRLGILPSILFTFRPRQNPARFDTSPQARGELNA